MKYEQFITENIRLVILQLLSEDNDYAHNDAVLKTALSAVGHTVSADKLKTELAWLAEQGAVTLGQVGDYTVAKLTARGLDVAQGRAQVPGIDRPGPSR